MSLIYILPQNFSSDNNVHKLRPLLGPISFSCFQNSWCLLWRS